MSLLTRILRKLTLPTGMVAIAFTSSFASTATAAEQDFTGQRVVHLLQEPRHRTVHQDGGIYVLDVQLNPGDQSLPHVHDSALLVTSISNGEGPTNGRVTANTDYATESLTHAISNAGPGLLRIIAMANLSPRSDPLTADPASGMQGEPTIENAWFRSYRIKLEPGAETSPLLLANPSVVVQVTEGKVHVTRGDGITAELDAMAKWTWRDANSTYQVRNVGGVPVELVINEARR